MPTVEWNRSEWDQRYGWDDGGDEWSSRWGGAKAQWLTCVYPRLARFLPAHMVLEIAPGYGRWTQFLLPQCGAYVGVDLAERCVQACRERFAAEAHAVFDVNDGLTLPMVPDESADLVFSFDSLVHVEDDVIGSYLQECRRVLSPDGVALVHHSNVGVYHRTAAGRDLLARATERFALSRSILGPRGLADWHNYRGRSMTAARFAGLARQADLSCIGQEIIGWSSPVLTDCISIVTVPGSRWDRELVRVTNRNFMPAALSSRAASRAFSL
jgi:SAM-dependent methyltransferase